jgi:hypothetical protein
MVVQADLALICISIKKRHCAVNLGQYGRWFKREGEFQEAIIEIYKPINTTKHN